MSALVYSTLGVCISVVCLDMWCINVLCFVHPVHLYSHLPKCDHSESCVAWEPFVCMEDRTVCFFIRFVVYIGWHVLHILYLILRWLYYVLIYNFTRYIHTVLWLADANSYLSVHIYVHYDGWCRRVQYSSSSVTLWCRLWTTEPAMCMQVKLDVTDI